MAASLYEELSAKLEKDPRLTKRGGPRVDLSLLLFNAREDVRVLWEAAQSVPGNAELEAAVERLRPIFGRR
ncbi:MAG: hypothetical protein GQE15_38720 [Archangiaceae bacterium]|nr:hypothetical protein [Archangiaceae bacterium]